MIMGKTGKTDFGIKDADTFRDKLEDILDEQFPKGECKERGHALVLFTYAYMFAKELETRA